FCVAGDGAGNLLSTATPGGPWAAPWGSLAVDPGHKIESVSCTLTLCVAVDDNGNALSSSTPLGTTLAAWTVTAIDPGKTLSGVSCTSDGLCVTVDTAGNLL